MDHKQRITSILHELFSNPKTKVIPEYFSSKYIAHTSKKTYNGLKIVSQWIQNLNSFLSDLKIVNLEFIHETDDTVVWKRTLKGKIKSSSLQNQNVGNIIKWEEMIVSKFNGSKIEEEWISSEFLGALLPKTKKKSSLRSQHK
ncbi:SnoaL-like polyketide cyclase [Leptospira yanagawae serovar Saopaulo str. Sao Paulo = ATCC 700523]|uniref:SnoaL-like polyketide cyclase n=1 Tax=Leptospira yanagawae serovar Saopaulo str. Sao Paulo = ATCC 700523 TaxID=1249483 RepID=A0A5E8HFR6_9LEPT|nr:ester cyclase [Leptospira yanagawae]EOQ89667.1 SnoaL-like polyketide cyclase [Leptospira yanagawae serovar Saopaulo str. Sao Paulo = ATCC 700523]